MFSRLTGNKTESRFFLLLPLRLKSLTLLHQALFFKDFERNFLAKNEFWHVIGINYFLNSAVFGKFNKKEHK